MRPKKWTSTPSVCHQELGTNLPCSPFGAQTAMPQRTGKTIATASKACCQSSWRNDRNDMRGNEETAVKRRRIGLFQSPTNMCSMPRLMQNMKTTKLPGIPEEANMKKTKVPGIPAKYPAQVSPKKQIWRKRSCQVSPPSIPPSIPEKTNMKKTKLPGIPAKCPRRSNPRQVSHGPNLVSPLPRPGIGLQNWKIQSSCSQCLPCGVWVYWRWL